VQLDQQRAALLICASRSPNRWRGRDVNGLVSVCPKRPSRP